LSTIIPQSSGTSPFDAIRQVHSDGSEYWSARTLMPLLGYKKWERFADAVEQAVSVIEAEDGPLAADREASRCREAFGRTRQVGDNFHLSRRASYLTAMRGDSRKDEVRKALVYFAVRTREAELATAAPVGDDLDMLDGMLRAMRADRQRLAALEQVQAVTAAKVAAIEGTYDWFTALGFAKLHDLPTNRPYLARVGRKAAALTRQGGEEPAPRQDATFGRVNTYPASALERAFAEVAK